MKRSCSTCAAWIGEFDITSREWLAGECRALPPSSTGRKFPSTKADDWCMAYVEHPADVDEMFANRDVPDDGA